MKIMSMCTSEALGHGQGGVWEAVLTSFYPEILKQAAHRPQAAHEMLCLASTVFLKHSNLLSAFKNQKRLHKTLEIRFLLDV